MGRRVMKLFGERNEKTLWTMEEMEVVWFIIFLGVYGYMGRPYF